MMGASAATPIPAATARRFKRVALPPEASRSPSELQILEYPIHALVAFVRLFFETSVDDGL